MNRYRNGVTLPEELWFGMEKGRWPVEAFPSKEMALYWAARGDRDYERVVFGPLEVPVDIPMCKAEVVPATQREVALP